MVIFFARMAIYKRNTFFIMLTGTQLLNQVFENREDDIKDIIRKCGYTTVTKAGKERILFTPFYEALLLAKGVEIL